jgi:hypothetical protein
MNDFLAFRKMITPMFIQIIFLVAAGLAVLGGLIAIVASLSQGAWAGVFGGLIFLVVGPILARIYCEVLIVIFKIHEELVAIRTGTPPTGQGFPVLPMATATPPAPGMPHP